MIKITGFWYLEILFAILAYCIQGLFLVQSRFSASKYSIEEFIKRLDNSHDGQEIYCQKYYYYPNHTEYS